jgi:hypothetical protein
MNRGLLKYFTKEDHLQASCCRWLLLNYPHLKWIHSPNEGKRSRFEQQKLNYIGRKQTAGFPDLMIFNDTSSGFKGYAIEFKVVYDSGKKNYPTPKQKKWLKTMEDLGYKAGICYSFDEFQEMIQNNF